MIFTQRRRIPSLLTMALVACSLSFPAFALQPQISSYRLRSGTDAQLLRLAKHFEVRRAPDGVGAEIIVPTARARELLALAPKAELLLKDISEPVRQAFQRSRGPANRQGLTGNGYHSLAEVQFLMKQAADQHPQTVALLQYGLSAEGKPLMALRLSNHLHDGVTVPRVMLTAATHGDEIITTEILLNLMNELLQAKSGSLAPSPFLDQLELLIIPVLNPDGFAEQNRYDNGEDPNRSYPYPENPSAKPTASIKGIIHLLEQFPITGSIDFHAYGRLIMYPWGYTRKPLPPANKKPFEDLTAKMAATNSYVHGQISRVIYVAEGSSCDFYFWKWNAFSLGIEVGDSKAPSASEITKYTLEQKKSTWLFLSSFSH